jgi:hypothetical protein
VLSERTEPQSGLQGTAMNWTALNWNSYCTVTSGGTRCGVPSYVKLYKLLMLQLE